MLLLKKIDITPLSETRERQFMQMRAVNCAVSIRQTMSVSPFK